MPPLPDEPYTVFVRPLNERGFQYMVTGSIASILYGEPRTTHDIDIVLVLPESRIREIAEIFPADQFYCPPREVLRIESARAADGHFNLIHQESGFKADVYLSGNERLHLWALENVRPVELDDGIIVPLAPPEYVIVRKLSYYRMGGSQKHVRDIRAMLQLAADQIDRTVLTEKIEAEGLSELWEEISSES